MRRGENIYKRRDGRWEGRYIYSRDEKGKAIYRSVYGHSYVETKEKLKNIRNITVIESRHTFSYFADNWLSSVKLNHKRSTFTKYSSLYTNHLKNELGNVNINLINCSIIKKMLEDKSYLSAKTRSDLLCIIKQIIQYAQKENIAINLTVFELSIHNEIKLIRVLTSAEHKILTDYLTDSQDICKFGVFLAMYTGLRIGELCALKRENIDLVNNILHVTNTLQRVKSDDLQHKTDVIITEPKSKCSIRDIPLPNFLHELCEKHYGGLKSEDFLLTGADYYIEPRTLRYRFNGYIKKCGLTDIHFHTLRHSFATRCIELGFDVKTLSEILGHHDVNITLNRYVHPSIELKKKNMNKLDGK